MNRILSLIFFIFLSVNVFSENSRFFPENLFLTGDVRTKWKSEWGGNENHSFKAEANIGCDYHLSDAWFSVIMKASTSNGKESIVLLDRSFLGYRLYDGDKGNVEIELGRNKMESLYTSKLQYGSYFNGLHVLYKYDEPRFYEFKIHGGPHVVNSDRHHLAWIAESQISQILNFPVTVTYSFTDWNAPKLPVGSFTYRDENFVYSISQFSVSYVIHKTILYGAYLINHEAEHHKDGFYMGFTMGKIVEKDDIEVDINFQACKSNAVCPYDLKGIKKGIQIKITYALAEALNLEGKFAVFDDHNGSNNNRRLEFAAIYSW